MVVNSQDQIQYTISKSILIKLEMGKKKKIIVHSHIVCPSRTIFAIPK